MAHNTLLTYTYFNEQFKIHTDASNFQLWAVIIQKVKPIDFHNMKLTDSKRGYIITETNLLSIVETLKKFRAILIGQILRIYTYSKNLTCKSFNTDILLRRIFILEEYGPDLSYIKREKNMVSVTLSRLPSNRNIEITQKPTYKKEIVLEINKT